MIPDLGSTPTALDGDYAPAAFARRLAEERATAQRWMASATAAGDRALVAEQRAKDAELRAMRAERALAATSQQPWLDIAMIVTGVLLVAAVIWVTGVRVTGGPL